MESLRLDASNGITYSNVGADYVALNRLEEAEAAYNEAEKRGIKGEVLLGNRYTLAFLQGNAGKMAELVSAAMGSRAQKISC